MNKNILVTGVKGQLGSVLCRLLKEKYPSYNVIGTDINDLDLTDEGAVAALFSKTKFDCVIHCAAYTQVDKAESEPQICYAANVLATKNLLSSITPETPFVLVSTDYVFDGRKNGLYLESDPVNPLGQYGYSKAVAEHLALQHSKSFIVRTSWVFGIGGHNFIETMLRLGASKSEISVVSDQIGSPTFAHDLALFLIELVHSNKYGIYHCTNNGFVSWAGFARKIFELSDMDVVVKDIPTSDYVTAAKRPLNSRLSKDKMERSGFTKMPDWDDALARYLQEREATD